jgi:hypothetical protein
MGRFSLKRLPSPGLTVGVVALIAALSGTAVALPGRNTVDSGDLKRGAVKTSDIARGAVTNSKVRNRTLTRAKVRTNTLTGAQIDESTLGEVPSAARARTATTADSATTANSANTANTANTANALAGETKLTYRATENSAEQQIYNDGTVRLTASCAVGGALTLSLYTLVDNAAYQSWGSNGAVADDDFDTGDNPDTISDADEERDLVYTNSSGSHVVALQYLAVEGAPFGTATSCGVSGVARRL